MNTIRFSKKIMLRICAQLICCLMLASCVSHSAPTGHKANLEIPGFLPQGTTTTPQPLSVFDQGFDPQSIQKCHIWERPNDPIAIDTVARTMTAYRKHTPLPKTVLTPILTRGHLNIGVDPSFAPFSYANPMIRGILIDIAQELNALIFPGTQPNFIAINGTKDLSQQLRNNIIDVALTPYPVTCGLRDSVGVTVPYMAAQLVSTVPSQASLLPDVRMCATISDAEYAIASTVYPVASLYGVHRGGDCPLLRSMNNITNTITSKVSLFFLEHDRPVPTQTLASMDFSGFTRQDPTFIYFLQRNLDTLFSLPHIKDKLRRKWLKKYNFDANDPSNPAGVALIEPPRLQPPDPNMPKNRKPAP